MKKLLPWILGAVCLGNVLWIMYLNSLYYLPSGNDPFHWLTRAKALVGGITYPLWSEGLLQYPPLSLVVLGIFSRVFGDILGTQLFGAIVLGFLPLSFFILVNKMFGPRVGVVASVFIAVTPILYEIWGWGGYPNLFGCSVMFFALFSILNFIELKNLKWGIIASLLIVLVIFSHHLTSMIFIGTLLIWTILDVITKRRIRELASVCLISLVVFVLYRVIIPPQYEVSNLYAVSVLAMNYPRFLWVFKYIPMFVLTILCTTYGCLLIYKKFPVYLFMVISFIASSFILTYGLPIIGIYLDPVRFLIFSVFGFTIPVAYMAKEVVFLTRAQSSAFFSAPHVKSLAIITILAVLLVLNGYIGLGTSWQVNRFYHSIVGITKSRGDADIRGLINWIKTNTGSRDVFVAEAYLSKIIMGLGERRVLEATNPAYLFMQGEIERAIAADSLLHSNYEIYHSSFRIRDQYPVQNHNPIIAMYQQGKYYDIVYFSDGWWYITLEKDGNIYDVSPKDVKTTTTTGFLSVVYDTSDVVFTRDVKIENGGLKIIFSAKPLQEAVTLLSMKVNGWRPWENHNLTDLDFNGTALTFFDDQIDAKVIITDCVEIEYYLADPVYNQAGFSATFKPEDGCINAEFFIPYVNQVENAPITLESKEIIQKYDVSYFAVLNSVRDEVWFLENNGYKKVYGNTIVSVYQVK